MGTDGLVDERSAAADFAQRFVETWNGRDIDGLLELLTDDVVWIDPNLVEPAIGRDEVREFLMSGLRAFPDLRFTKANPQHTTVCGDEIAHNWVMEGTMLDELDPPGFLPTGRRFQVDGIDAWIMRDGKISLYRTYYDTARIARQLGLLPSEGSRAERMTVVLQRMRSRLSRPLRRQS